jgi:pimeloyl-ACP methyl ester carboxylesterase
MRGHGGTRFRAATPRSAQQAALGRDLIDFIDALHLPEAVFAGFGWGAQAARAASVVRPTRCVGLVLADIERIAEDGPFERYLFRSTLGQRTLRAAPSFDHPDFGAILTHAWTFRHAGAAPDPAYATLEKKFALAPPATATSSLTGHHLPFQAPHVFAAAVLERVRTGAWRT